MDGKREDYVELIMLNFIALIFFFFFSVFFGHIA